MFTIVVDSILSGGYCRIHQPLVSKRVGHIHLRLNHSGFREGVVDLNVYTCGRFNYVGGGWLV